MSFRHAAALVFALLACVCACQDDQVVPRLISGRVQLPGGTPDAVVVSRIEWPESQYSPLAVKSGVFEIDQTSAQEGHLVTIDAKQNGVKMGYLITDGRHLLRPIHVTLLSEYASRRLDDFLEAVPTARFEFLQNRIAQALVQSDIDGDGIVDYRDILAFDPDDPAQVAKLSFDYHEVLDRKLACNCTLRDTYATPTDAHDIEARLSEVFDSIVDVDLPNAEGPASLASVFVDVDAGGSLTIDELPSVSLDSLNRQYFYRIEDDTQPTTLTLHATPAETYHFVRWVGCDEPHGDTCVVHASSSAPIVSAQFGLEEKVRDGVILVRLDAFEVGTVSILPTALGWQVLAKKDSPADKAFAAVQAGTLIATGRADMPLAKIGAVTTSRDDAAEGRVRYVFAVTEAPPTEAYETITAFEPDRDDSIDDVQSIEISDSPAPAANLPNALQSLHAKRIVKEPIWLVGYGRAFDLGDGLYLTQSPETGRLSVARALDTPKPVTLTGGATQLCTIIGSNEKDGCIFPAAEREFTLKKIFKVKLSIEAALSVRSNSSITFAAPFYVAFETRGQVRFTIGAEASFVIAAKAQAFATCRAGNPPPGGVPRSKPSSALLASYDDIPDTLSDARVETNVDALTADNAKADDAVMSCGAEKKTSLDAKTPSVAEKLDVKDIKIQLNKGTPEGVAFPVLAGFKLGVEAKGNVGAKIKFVFETTTSWDAGFEIGKKCRSLFSCDDTKSNAVGRARSVSGHKFSVALGANGVISPYATLGIYAGVSGVKDDFLKLEGTLSFPLKVAGHAGGISYSSLSADRAAGTNGWCVQNKVGLLVGLDAEASFGLSFDARIRKSVFGLDVDFGGTYDVFKLVKTVPIFDTTAILSRTIPSRGTCRSIDDTPVVDLPAQLVFSPGDIDWVDPGMRRLTKTHQLELQQDGNFVLSRLVRDASGKITERKALWGTGTNGRFGARTAFQKDGNLVVYGLDERAAWASGSYDKSATQLRLQQDGNLVIADGKNAALWASGTNGL